MKITLSTIPGLQGPYGGPLPAGAKADVLKIVSDPWSYATVSRTPQMIGCVDPRLCANGERIICPRLAGGSLPLLYCRRYMAFNAESFEESMRQLEKLGFELYRHGPECGAIKAGVEFVHELFQQTSPWVRPDVHDLLSQWALDVSAQSPLHGGFLGRWAQSLPGNYLESIDKLPVREVFAGELKSALVVVTKIPGRVFTAHRKIEEATGGMNAFGFEPWVVPLVSARLSPGSGTMQSRDRLILEKILYSITAGVIFKLSAEGVMSCVVTAP